MAVASPAVWPSFADVWVGDAFDGAGDYARNDVFAGASRLGFGPLAPAPGPDEPAAHTHWAEGGHDQCLWRLIAPQQVAFAVAALRA